MKPYYEKDGITIYHGDCREILPTLPKVDLVLTDPPYGIGYALPAAIVGKGNRRIQRGGKPPIHGDNSPFDPSHLMALGRCVLWGANYYSDKLPTSGGWIAWDKTGGGRGPDNSFTDVELAWTNLCKHPQIFRHLWKGLVRDSEAGDKVQHPTQKPVALMAWILEKWTRAGQIILDPYTGSGPVILAAKNLGRKAIGIEIEEKYCEIAVKRLAQGVLL